MYRQDRRFAIPELLPCIVLLVMISGCSSKSDATFPSNSTNLNSSGTSSDLTSSGTNSPISVSTTTFTRLTWNAPRFYEDNTAIGANDITEYRVYLYEDAALQTNSTGTFYFAVSYDPMSGVTPTSITFNDLNNFLQQFISGTKKTRYLTVTAVTTGIESTPSNSLIYTFP